MKISEGRDFREEDKAKRYGTFVFNERARTEYGLEIGSLIDSMEIVGFMPDVKFCLFPYGGNCLWPFLYGVLIIGETNLITLI